jgi:hypothetical protein
LHRRKGIETVNQNKAQRYRGPQRDLKVLNLIHRFGIGGTGKSARIGFGIIKLLFGGVSIYSVIVNMK